MVNKLMFILELYLICVYTHLVSMNNHGTSRLSPEFVLLGFSI